MRVKLSGSSRNHFSVTNADTGEELRGVTHAELKASPVGSELILRICDFEVDVEIDDEQERHSITQVSDGGQTQTYPRTKPSWDGDDP